MSDTIFIFPNDLMRERDCDTHFSPERNAAREAGYQTFVFGDYALREGRAAEAVRSIPAGEAHVIYRGWMLTPTLYGDLYQALADKGYVMRTSPDQYAQAHQGPGWYGAMEGLTARSVWQPSENAAEILAAAQQSGFQSAIVKDYVKSAKHAWAEACYIPDLSNTAHALAVINRFLELRREGEGVVGGLVLREFEDYYGREIRTFWVDGECVLRSLHPDDRGDLLIDVDVAPFAPAVKKLGLPFISLDLVERIEGGWHVVEVGDGQVSDRHPGVRPTDFIQAIS